MNWLLKIALTFLSFVILISCKVSKGAEKNVFAYTLQDQHVFLFVHGAWGGGWEYAQVDSILTKKGNMVYRPTLTGLGERVHLSTSSVNLTTHIMDIINVINFENLDNIVLVGHSYGGMVISGVVEQVPEKIEHLVYLDAFVPNNGDSAKSIIGEDAWNKVTVPKIKDGLIPYFLGTPKSYPPTDVPQPVNTFTESLTINNPLVKKIPTSYILMTKDGTATFEAMSKRALEKGWKIYKMEGGHYAMRDQPEALVEKLLNVILK